MEFDIDILIERSPDIVFAFLRDKDTYPQERGSPVLLLEKTTPGPCGVGTRYRDSVLMKIGRGHVWRVPLRICSFPSMAEPDSSNAR